MAKLSHRLPYLLLRAVAGGFNALPLPAARKLARSLGRLVHVALRRGRRYEETLDTLRRALPERTESERRAIVRANYEGLAVLMAEFVRAPRLSPEQVAVLVDIPPDNALTAALAEGRGAVALGAHFSNWELEALAIGYGISPVAIVVKTQSNPLVDAYVNGLRTVGGVNRMVPMGVSVREIITTLRGNGLVGLLGDQAASEDAFYASFFGRPAATFLGPATFALKMNAPLVLMLAVRQPDGHYVLETERIPTDDLTGGATTENVARLTQRHVTRLEATIRRHPEQWLWLHRRFKRPPADLDAWRREIAPILAAESPTA